MVTNGADKALPIIVRCSNAIPKVLTNRTAVKQYDGSECSDDNIVIFCAVDDDDDDDGFVVMEYGNGVVVGNRGDRSYG